MILTIDIIVFMSLILFLIFFFIFNSFYTIEVKFKNSKNLKTKNREFKTLFNIKGD